MMGEQSRCFRMTLAVAFLPHLCTSSFVRTNLIKSLCRCRTPRGEQNHHRPFEDRIHPKRLYCINTKYKLLVLDINYERGLV